MKRMRSVLAMLLALVMVLALAACGGSSSNTPAASNDAPAAPGEAAPAAESGSKTLDVLRVAVYGDSTFTGCFDISGAYAGTGAGFGTGFMVYDTPFYLTATGEYKSRIIEDYKWEDDLTFVMKLRDNILFTNGDKLTGDDILYSLEKMQNSGRRSGYYVLWDVNSSTVSEDGLTLTLKCFEPYAAFYMGLDFFILDKDYVEEKGPENIDWYDVNQYVGSGPYKCTNLVSGASATYEKRDDYWGKAYGFDDAYEKVEVTQYSDQTTMAIDLEQGNVDLALSLGRLDFERLMDNKDDNIETVLVNSNVVYQLCFDLNNCEPLKDIRVREAIAHCINTEALTNAVAGVYGTPAGGTFGRGEIGFKELTYSYDPELSKQLLAEAGYEPGDINLHFATIGQEPYTTIAEILQGYLSEIGIGLEIDALEFMAFVSNASTPGFTDLQIYTMMGGNPNGEPVIHLDNWKPGSTAPVMSRGEEYGKLIAAGETTLDTAEREKIYGDLQQLFYDNVDGVGLYEWNIGYAYNTDKIASLPLGSMTDPWIFDVTLK